MPIASNYGSGRGGSPGGSSGFGGRTNDRNKSSRWGSFFSGFFDALSVLNPATAAANALKYAATGDTIGDSIKSDIGGPFGTPPLGPMMGFDSGSRLDDAGLPFGPVSDGGRGGNDVKPSIAAEPVVEEEPATARVAGITRKKRRKIGRQQTILTSALGDAPTLRPTLLGQ